MMIPTTKGAMSPAQIIEELNYCCYAHNRRTASAETLARLFPETWEAMERRYQREQKAAE